MNFIGTYREYNDLGPHMVRYGADELISPENIQAIRDEPGDIRPEEQRFLDCMTECIGSKFTTFMDRERENALHILWTDDEIKYIFWMPGFVEQKAADAKVLL